MITIYDPITIDMNDVANLVFIENKYGIKKREFYFTVSSLLPHKNLSVLLNVMKEIKDKDIDLPRKLIISGVGGKSKKELVEKIKSLGLEDNIQLTSFIENNERNALYKYCRAFLFPSVFEGFGMPPIEAMLFDTPVVTTRKTCLEEITQGKANYVNDPYDAHEFVTCMKNVNRLSYNKKFFTRYNIETIASQYLQIIMNN